MTQAEIRERLQALYRTMAAGIILESRFPVYNHFGWAANHAADRSAILQAAETLPALGPREYVAAYRIGLKVPRRRVNLLLANAEGALLRFELLVIAYFLLPPAGFLSLVEAENTDRHPDVTRRNILASLEAFARLKLTDSWNDTPFSRWQTSEDLEAFAALLANPALLAAEPETFIDRMAMLGQRLAHPIAPFFTPARLVRSLAEFRASDMLAPILPAPETITLANSPAGGEPVILVTAERHYFEKYALTFLRSCAEAVPVQLVHLHLVNHRISENEAQALAAQTGVRLNVTTETYDGDVMAIRTLAALARFIHLPRFMEWYEYLVVTDIDGRAAFSAADLAAIPRGSIGLHKPVYRGAETETFLWKNFHAGRTLFREPPMQPVRSLARFVESGFVEGTQAGNHLWHLDQIGLSLMARAWPALPLVASPPLFTQIKQAQ